MVLKRFQECNVPAVPGLLQRVASALVAPFSREPEREVTLMIASVVLRD
jgi:hypothetical protein